MSTEAKQLTEEELLEKRETARRERLETATKARRFKDRTAIIDIEESDTVELTIIDLAYRSDDLPVLIALRPPTDVELKRYRAGLKRDDKGNIGDATAVTNQIGRTCCVYPDAETLKKLSEHFGTLETQMGTEVLALSRGKVRAEGKG